MYNNSDGTDLTGHEIEVIELMGYPWNFVVRPQSQLKVKNVVSNNCPIPEGIPPMEKTGNILIRHPSYVNLPENHPHHCALRFDHFLSKYSHQYLWRKFSEFENSNPVAKIVSEKVAAKEDGLAPGHHIGVWMAYKKAPSATAETIQRCEASDSLKNLMIAIRKHVVPKFQKRMQSYEPHWCQNATR